MILVRDVFRLKFGKAKEAKALWKENQALRAKLGMGPSRATVDFIGPHYYTFVMEGTYDNVAAFEKLLQTVFAAPEFAQWYGKFAPLVESGRREIFTVVE